MAENKEIAKNFNPKIPASYRLYYFLRPFIPRGIQIFLRQQIVNIKKTKISDVWPIDDNIGNPSVEWYGWPQSMKFAVILMHDVDTQIGHDKCIQLMDIEEELGFKSAFNIVPERYRVSDYLIEEIKKRKFGLGVHGLKHDGKLFLSERRFRERAQKINFYLENWNTKGFSSPSMHCNLSWMKYLNIDYATSTFDTDPFEPQPCGVKYILPFWVDNFESGKRYLEMPYTLAQDFTLFILMKEKNNSMWKKKTEYIANRGGMLLLNTHPDYMNFSGEKLKKEEYDINLYIEFLKWLKYKFRDKFWKALPSDVESFMKNRAIDELD